MAVAGLNFVLGLVYVYGWKSLLSLEKRVDSCKVPLTSKWNNSQAIEPKIDSHIEAQFLTIATNRTMFSGGFIFRQFYVEEIIRS